MPRTASPSFVQKALPLFATLFIVIGAAAVAMLRPKDAPVVVNDQIPPPVTATTGTVTVLQNANGKIQFRSDDGSIRDCPLSWVDTRIRRVSKDGLEIGIDDDQLKHVGFDCIATDSTSPRGLLNPSGTRGAHVGEAKSDGAGAIVFSDGKNETEIVLRNPKSRPYRDPSIVGWLDDARLVVVVFQGDGRVALAVESTGSSVQLAALPEEAMEFAANGGAFWYVTATQGPGIEFGPRGPSDLHRVMDGKDTVIAKDADDAMEGLSAGPSHRFAYLAAGALFTGQEEARNVGTGAPFGWMDDGTLLVSRNGLLSLIPPITTSGIGGAATDTKVAIPEDADHAWRVTLDETAPAR